MSCRASGLSACLNSTMLLWPGSVDSTVDPKPSYKVWHCTHQSPRNTMLTQHFSDAQQIPNSSLRLPATPNSSTLQLFNVISTSIHVLPVSLLVPTLIRHGIRHGSLEVDTVLQQLRTANHHPKVAPAGLVRLRPSPSDWARRRMIHEETQKGRHPSSRATLQTIGRHRPRLPLDFQRSSRVKR